MICFYCERQILSPSRDIDFICFNCEMFLIKHGVVYHNDYENNEICNHSFEWFKNAIKKNGF